MPKRLIWLDFVILLKTVRVVWKGEGEKEYKVGEELIDI